MDRIPILKLGDLLLVTIQVDMHDKLATTLQDDLTSKIGKVGAKGVLIDISALEMVDSFIGRVLANISAMSRVLGAQTVVVGMQPAVAITLVELGLELTGVLTALDVELGMVLLRREIQGDMSNVLQAERIPVRQEQDVVAVRQAVRRVCLDLKFSLVDQTKMVTAASELARNLLIYGGGGEVRLETLETHGRRGLCARFHDEGPGIADIEQAMKDGYTTGSGLGLGLSGARRLVNEFHLDSAPGQGTRIAITRWK